MKDGARQSKACEALGLSERTIQRWVKGDDVLPDNRKNDNRSEPTNKFSETEEQAIIDVCNSELFNSLPPSQIVPILADEGEYLGLKEPSIPKGLQVATRRQVSEASLSPRMECMLNNVRNVVSSSLRSSR